MSLTSIFESKKSLHTASGYNRNGGGVNCCTSSSCISCMWRHHKRIGLRGLSGCWEGAPAPAR